MENVLLFLVVLAGATCSVLFTLCRRSVNPAQLKIRVLLKHKPSTPCIIALVITLWSALAWVLFFFGINMWIPPLDSHADVITRFSIALLCGFLSPEFVTESLLNVVLNRKLSKAIPVVAKAADFMRITTSKFLTQQCSALYRTLVAGLERQCEDNRQLRGALNLLYDRQALHIARDQVPKQKNREWLKGIFKVRKASVKIEFLANHFGWESMMAELLAYRAIAATLPEHPETQWPFEEGRSTNGTPRNFQRYYERSEIDEFLFGETSTDVAKDLSTKVDKGEEAL